MRDRERQYFAQFVAVVKEKNTWTLTEAAKVDVQEELDNLEEGANVPEPTQPRARWIVWTLWMTIQGAHPFHPMTGKLSLTPSMTTWTDILYRAKRAFQGFVAMQKNQETLGCTNPLRSSFVLGKTNHASHRP